MDQDVITVIFCLPGSLFSNRFLESWSELLFFVSEIKSVQLSAANSRAISTMYAIGFVIFVQSVLTTLSTHKNQKKEGHEDILTEFVLFDGRSETIAY
ncbi:MAG: hypothetical protein A2268_14070 [Candidatus Raymondbacteria bacterium RifOxyA12_full_50_37]|uniref:Uncharacterized protein n=1 Tax=Candidatus Raymondbacteria bacterium RIFOXYD12_FULL_49_13 TaxID=1817890 RepID=A0A1F7FKX7_UNCRA|nr:MAG: hypothetical protein A2268_14070 [Candidatus Raymondbacteria bacterium RifOxyA12_full_50_37]OGJ88205.1 MAG: hypothetical protein A2248_19410 [Candidatus Raymondbacteria bacterium RIFOXYA2_FULL_49_16]OGJ93978.1 MAG: hypothetical protein A2487_08835 [Candidatus Raymondbacteria bacterium RifOxyC12_full_50_8]OGJ94992.1 MAG: hypothetical protein A2350_09630 [Candidatus Raymondbacteria bacterium RifOxyB12_full_50_8]OGK07251.1 MAG: hypothetical protein A2519_14075 [Candidatus Raymondbacteria b